MPLDFIISENFSKALDMCLVYFVENNLHTSGLLLNTFSEKNTVRKMTAHILSSCMFQRLTLIALLCDT